MELAAGTAIDGRYVVVDVIGRGAMADVYLVRHEQLATVHALKVLQLPTQVIRQRLVTEGRIQGALRHPNVVAVTDLVDVEGSPGLVMELVRGPSLDRLHREVALELQVIRALGAQILLGVQAAHRAGHVHRDLKPANVLVDVVGEALVAKIADFGLAKLTLPDDASTTATRTGSTLGTPAYMAPEQIRDARNVDERADLFSLGALLYELVTRARAFPGQDVLEVYDRIRVGRYEPVAELRSDVPEGMVRAIDGALRVAREERFSDAGAMLAAWTDGIGEDAVRIRWPLELVQRVPTLGPLHGRDERSFSQSSSTFHGESVATEPPTLPPLTGVAVWEDEPAPVRRTPRIVVVAASASLAAFLVTLAAAAVGAALLGLGWLEVGEEAPHPASRLGSVLTPTAPPDLVAGRLDRLVADLEPTLGPLGSREGQCADPRPCLMLAAGLSWLEDAHAWGWLEAAERQARGRDGADRLARRMGGVVRDGIDPAAAQALVDYAGTDGLLAVLLLAGTPDWDGGARMQLAQRWREAHPDDLAVRLVIARTALQRGRRTEALEALRPVLDADPDHPLALALRAEVALGEGGTEPAIRFVDPTGYGPWGMRVRAAARRSAGPDGTAGLLEGIPTTDLRARVAFHVGRAEAALGLGFLAEADEQLALAYDLAGPLDTGPAVWSHSELALLTEDEGRLAEASRRVRVLAAAPVSPAESARLNNRADLLDGLRALTKDDRRALDQARAALGERRGGRRWLLLLHALEQARRGSVPKLDPLETCVFELMQARWLDEADTEKAVEPLRRVASGEGACGAFGVDRYAREEAWVRYAVRRAASGGTEDARAALDAYTSLVQGFEPPFVERAEALRTELQLDP